MNAKIEKTNEANANKAKAKLSKEEEAYISKLESTSMKIRYLAYKNYSRSEIANILNKRYQHIRNVLITPIKKEVKF